MHRASSRISLLIALFVWLSISVAQDEPGGDAVTGAPSLSEHEMGVGTDSVYVSVDSTVVDTTRSLWQRKDPTFAMVQSFVIPGLGQAYTGHWIKAAVFFGIDVGMVTGIFRQDARYRDWLDKSKNQKTDADRREYERVADFYRDDRNKLIWWTAGLTMISAFDAYVEAHLYEFDIDPSLGMDVESEALKLGIKITF